MLRRIATQAGVPGTGEELTCSRWSATSRPSGRSRSSPGCQRPEQYVIVPVVFTGREYVLLSTGDDSLVGRIVSDISTQPFGVRLRTCALARSSFACNFARSASASALVGKEFACAPPRIAIQDVPFKYAVRAGMPPHIKKLFHRPQSSLPPPASPPTPPPGESLDPQNESGRHCPPCRWRNRKLRTGSTTPPSRFDHWP